MSHNVFTPPQCSSHYSPIPVLHELASLYVELHKIIREFEKLERYSIGVEIEKTLLSCIHECFRATTFPSPTHKLAAAVAASAHFDTVKMFIRMTTRMSCMSEKQYVLILPHLAAIGAMLGGWIKELGKSKS